MADFASLSPDSDTWQEIQRTYRRLLAASMARWMPTANALTRELTATILARYGLLDEPPAVWPPAVPSWPATGRAR